MAQTPPTYHIKSKGKYKYLVDDWGNKKFWLHDDKYISSVDGRKHKKGWLHNYDAKWYEVRWYKDVVAYVKK